MRARMEGVGGWIPLELPPPPLQHQQRTGRLTILSSTLLTFLTLLGPFLSQAARTCPAGGSPGRWWRTPERTRTCKLLRSARRIYSTTPPMLRWLQRATHGDNEFDRYLRCNEMTPDHGSQAAEGRQTMLPPQHTRKYPAH
jgi:hypothetical protein